MLMRGFWVLVWGVVFYLVASLAFGMAPGMSVALGVVLCACGILPAPGATARRREDDWDREPPRADYGTGRENEQIRGRRVGSVPRRIVCGLLWAAVLYVVSLMILGGVVGVRAAQQVLKPDMAGPAASRAAMEVALAYRFYVYAGSLALALALSFVGILPGSRERPGRSGGSGGAWFLAILLSGLALAVAVFLALPQPRLTPEQFTGVRPGMTQADIEDLFGVPPGDYSYGGRTTVSVMNHRNHQTWIGLEHGITVFFDHRGRVVDSVTYEVRHPFLGMK